MKKSLISALCIVSCACSSATIYRHGAPDLEATIVGGSEDYLYVETDDGRVVRVDRKKIVEIDHPGNVEAVLGTVWSVTGGGLILLATQLPNDSAFEHRPLAVAVGAIFLVPGVILLAHGLASWSHSTAAADQTDLQLPLRFPPPVTLAPPATVDVQLPAPPTLLAP